MPGLSRRRFIQTVGGVAVAFGVPASAVAEVLLAPRAVGADVPGSTLAATIRPFSAQGRFKRLGSGPGEPFLLREDLGAQVSQGRVTQRRSLLYLGQLSDTHVKDSQSPQAFEAAEVLYLLGTGDAHRPQEALTTQVLDRMVASLRNLAVSPVTGAPMAFVVTTGDITDIDGGNELRWFLDVLDGKEVVPDSGAVGTYEGPQAWSGIPWAYHPDGGSGAMGDVYSRFDYPRWNGLLDAATQAFTAVGSPAPYFVVFGNHDTTWNGTLDRYWLTDMLATGNRMNVDIAPLASLLLTHGGPKAADAWKDAVSDHWNGAAYIPGTRRLTPDPSRATLDSVAFMARFWETAADPGPVGHGFTDANLSSGETWWSHDDGLFLHVGLDSCNHATGSNGSLNDSQFAWLTDLLSGHSTRHYSADGSLVENPAASDRLVILYSHHNSFTMDNTAADPEFPGPRHFGPEIVRLLLRFPNVIAWVNGHSHKNTILGHRSPYEQGAGFWEINAASCIDYPQQNRVIEVVDNRDGTLSLFTIVVDHVAPPETAGVSYDLDGLAAISRELAFNDPFGADMFERLRSGDLEVGDPLRRMGDIEDRNAELVVRAPIALDSIEDSSLELRRVLAAGRVGASGAL